MKKLLLISLLLLFTSACQTLSNPEDTLYVELGGAEGVERLADQFIIEITHDPLVRAHFEDSNMRRFREKFIEHACHLSGGGCDYTGDTMIDVHTGMDISEAEFNVVVQNLIDAMDTLSIKTTTQNRLLAILAKLREEIIYR